VKVGGGGFALLLRDDRESIFGEACTTGQDSGTTTDVDVVGADFGVAGVAARLTVRGSTCVGYTSVTSSMPSSTYMTSCIVSW